MAGSFSLRPKKRHLKMYPSLNLTASLPLKMHGWNTFSFPFEIANFQGRLLLVSGRVSNRIHGTIVYLPTFS